MKFCLQAIHKCSRGILKIWFYWIYMPEFCRFTRFSWGNFFWRNSLRVKSLTFQNSGLSSASEWYCVNDHEWHLWQTWYTSINYQNLKKLWAESILVRFCQPCKVRKKLLLEKINSQSNISDDGGEENLCGLLALGSWVRCGALAHCVTISLFTPTLIMMMNMVTMVTMVMVMVMLHINMLPIFSQCYPPTIASSKMFIFFYRCFPQIFIDFKLENSLKEWLMVRSKILISIIPRNLEKHFHRQIMSYLISISQLLIFIYIWKLLDSNSFQILIWYFTVAKVFEQNGLFSKWIAEKDIFCHKLEGLGY